MKRYQGEDSIPKAMAFRKGHEQGKQETAQKLKIAHDNEISRLAKVSSNYSVGFQEGKSEALKEVLAFIENERDNGNVEDDYKGTAFEGCRAFSAGICLSNLMKRLKEGGK